LDKPVKHFKSP